MNLSSTVERSLSPTLRVASVRISRQVSAAPERIFDAWLSAENARIFLFAGRSRGAVSSESDPRVGGRFRIVRHSGGEHVEYSGEYLEIDRPYRLVFSLFIENSPSSPFGTFRNRLDAISIDQHQVSGCATAVIPTVVQALATKS